LNVNENDYDRSPEKENESANESVNRSESAIENETPNESAIDEQKIQPVTWIEPVMPNDDPQENQSDCA
jgi:hypothetical protein